MVQKALAMALEVKNRIYLTLKNAFDKGKIVSRCKLDALIVPFSNVADWNKRSLL